MLICKSYFILVSPETNFLLEYELVLVYGEIYATLFSLFSSSRSVWSLPK